MPGATSTEDNYPSGDIMRLGASARRAGAQLLLICIATCPVRAQHAVGPDAQPLDTKPAVQLRLVPGKIENGLPEEFTFLFLNISDHELRMPRPSQCSGGAGTVLLRSHFAAANPLRVPSGGGGGCGAGHAVSPGVHKK